MEVRLLEDYELSNAAGLSRYVFDNTIRNRMEFEQTISYVEEYLTEDNFRTKKLQDGLLLWGAFENGQLLGVSAMQRDGLVTALYVLPQCERHGLGEALLREMRIHARDVWKLEQVVVNATPAWTAYYFKQKDFEPMYGQIQLYSPFVSMCSKLNTFAEYPKKKVSSLAIGLTVLGLFVFATALGIGYLIYYIMH